MKKEVGKMIKIFTFMVALFAILFGFNINAHALTINSRSYPWSVVKMDAIVPGKTTVYKISDDNDILYCARGNNHKFEGPMSLNCEPLEKNANAIKYIYENSPGRGKGSISDLTSNLVDGKLPADVQDEYSRIQAAVWYFTEIPSNVSSSSLKNSSAGSLITEAENFDGAKLSLELSSSNMIKNGGYYISSPIKVNAKYLDGEVSLSLTGLSSAFVTNSKDGTNGISSVSDGDTIYIKVPKDANISNSRITLSVSGSTKYGKLGELYLCSPTNGMQPVTYYQPPEITKKDLSDSVTVVTPTEEIKKTKVYVSKVDLSGNEEISGAKLAILSGSREVAKWVSDGTTKEIELDVGNYELVELEAPKGYIKSSSGIKFTVTKDNKVKVDGVVVNKLVMKNSPIEIIISKQDIASGNELPGAHLEVLDMENNVVTDLDGNTLSWVSTEEAHKFKIPAGKYKLVETIAPNGYAKSNEEIEFEVLEDGKIKGTDGNTVIMKNGRIKIVISKRELNKTDELPGAVLQLFDVNNNLIKEWETGKNGKPTEISISAGKYYLKEKSAPDGYDLSDKIINFEVTEEGKLLIDNKEQVNNLVIFNNIPELIESPPTGNFVIYAIASLGITALVVGGYFAYNKYVKNKK